MSEKICLNCDGDGYIINRNGKTKECVMCDGTGEHKYGEDDN
jgi:RecJ-like exonuclease